VAEAEAKAETVAAVWAVIGFATDDQVGKAERQ
jgi:hypothetical protein